MHWECVQNKPIPCCCNSSVSVTELRLLWFVAVSQITHLVQGLENMGVWASLNYSVFMNIGRSEVSESWNPIGIIKNISNSLWTHYKSKFWRGRCWDLLPFLLEVCRLWPWRAGKLPSFSKSWETRGALPPNISYLPALPSNFSVLHVQQRYALRFALTGNCSALTLPRGFLQQRSGSP